MDFVSSSLSRREEELKVRPPKDQHCCSTVGTAVQGPTTEEGELTCLLSFLCSLTLSQLQGHSHLLLNCILESVQPTRSFTAWKRHTLIAMSYKLQEFREMVCAVESLEAQKYEGD